VELRAPRIVERKNVFRIHNSQIGISIENDECLFKPREREREREEKREREKERNELEENMSM
jgi:hypothetical protein